MRTPRVRPPLPRGPALSLAAVAVCWDTLQEAALLEGAVADPLALAAHAAFGAMVLLPAAWLAVRVAERLDSAGDSGPVLRASLVALAFLATSAPALTVRTVVHRSLEERVPALRADTAGLFATTQEDAFACSVSAGATDASGMASWLVLPATGLRRGIALVPFVLLTSLLAFRPRRPRRRAAATATPLMLLLAGCAAAELPHEGASPAPEPHGRATAPETQPPVCATGGEFRRYDVSAIPVRLTLNRFGDHVPDSFMYVLDERIPDVRAEEARPLPDRVSTGLRRDAIQPLVIRANFGDCLTIRFTNRLSAPASMHIHGLAHGQDEAGGGAIGNNPIRLAAPGASVTYTFEIPGDAIHEGAHYFHDYGASRQRIAFGLFGALVLEPTGSTWLDPESGAPLAGSNWEAIIDVPGGPSFREFVLQYHELGDEEFDEILDRNGDDLPVVDDLAGIYRPASRAINYRSEPFRDRLLLGSDKSLGYSSYTFGDPATPIPRSYLGEPTKTRLLHAGSEVFHVHHLHGGGVRWRANPAAEPRDTFAGLQKRPVQNALSTRLDSQSIGPGTAFNLEHECGAGGCQQAAGDFLFHCHIQNHYLAGMWAFWRVFDTLQPDLAVIPGRTPPPGAVDSTGLIGRTIEGKTLVPRALLADPTTQRALEDWIESQLPPPGPRLHDEDATTWDWVRAGTAAAPLYLGEPETSSTWPNYVSPTPGQRPTIRFNPDNGRYAWPLFRPHLAQRPPFSGQGHAGAPWLGEDGSALRPDGLCPDDTALPNPDRKRRIYPVTTIAVPIPVSRERDDEDGMLFVLNEDKAAVLAGTKPRVPLVLRSNVGDCVDLVLTNEIPDLEINDQHSKTNLHTHFVQFDPQASDGVISGLSYEQSVRPYTLENRTLADPATAGADTVRVTNTSGLRPGIWLGVGLGEGMCDPPGGGEPVACTEVRRIDAIAGDVVTLEAPLGLNHAAGEHAGVEFVRLAWYSDVDSGTVFWHDHIVKGGWPHGLYGAHIVEPAGSTWHDPVTGLEVRSGAIVDVHAPADATVGAAQLGSFRELFVALSDDVEDALPTVNLRSEPFSDRDGSGSGSGQAQLFSSVRHGDPVTPLARAYAGDPFVIRGLGVVEDVGTLRVTGHRFKQERFAGLSATTDAAFLGISERFDLVLEGGAGGPGRYAGDYLYYNGIGRHFTGGAWGLIRVHDTRQADLQPLPDRAPPAPGAGFPHQRFTGGSPARATDPGAPCPPTAAIRRYDLALTRATIEYHPDVRDSGGVTFVPRSLVQALQGSTVDAGSGGCCPSRGDCCRGGGADPVGSGEISRGQVVVREPLVMRVVAGECLEVELTNLVDRPAAPTVSKLRFDPQGSFGPAIGFNLDSTVAPGETRTFRFWADTELGTAYAMNLADPFLVARGASAAVIVEPPGSSWRDPATGAPNPVGIRADVVTPTHAFREFVALFHDEDERIGQSAMPYHSDVRGFTGISFAADPLAARGLLSEPARAFDSRRFGDPKLVFRVHVGDEAVFRVAQPWGEQAHVFSVENAYWPGEPDLPGSEEPMAANLGPGLAIDCRLNDGASRFEGDHLFLDHRQPFLEAGLWGLFRVLPPADRSIRPLPTFGP